MTSCTRRLPRTPRRPRQIADDLGISIKTVEAHRASIMDKTNSGTVADLMRVVMGTAEPAKFLDSVQPKGLR